MNSFGLRNFGVPAFLVRNSIRARELRSQLAGDRSNTSATQKQLTGNQRFARWATQSTKIDPKFPSRPTDAQIDAEYTPTRVMRLARYIAKARGPTPNAEQFEEDVAQCCFSIYNRINQYKRGEAKIGETYTFYFWLLFQVRTDLRDVRRREARSLAGRQITRVTEATPAPEPKQEQSESLDLESAIATLSPRQQRIVKAYYYESKTQVEIAEDEGISQPAVATALMRSQDKLKKVLGDNYYARSLPPL